MHQPQTSADFGHPDRNHRFTAGWSCGFGLKPRFLSRISAGFFVLAWLFLPIAIPDKCVHAYTLADTGQTKCYNDTDNITCPSPGEPFYGQDGNYNGASPAYKDNGDGTVTDLNTGLTWQQGEGLYNRSWQYAIDYCDSLSLAEHDDWRLPTFEELFSLIKIGKLSSGNIDREVFPTASSSFYWSSSINANDQDSPLTLNFGYASVYSTYKTAPGVHTRCVRGETLPSATYVDNLDGTITDNRTGLIWQQADDGTERDWEQALAYCESLELAGHSDWRLPDYRELMSLADYSRYDPVINLIFDCRSEKYWSSSTYDQTPHVAPSYAFSLNFVGAGSGGSPELKGGKEYVRCVRGGNATPSQPTISQTPMSGPPLTTFTQWGTGFTPNSIATLHFKKPDGTEYPTKNQPIDNSGNFEINPKYTAPWNKPPGTYTWWAIDGSTGMKSNEASYVIEGVAGEAIRLSVTLDGTQLIPNQNVNASFPIKIQALDYTGNVASSFNGQVFLYPSGPGYVFPYLVPLTNGSGGDSVTITEPSQVTHIHAQCSGIYGDSNDFAVLSGAGSFGSIRGYVYTSDKRTVEGATVNLADKGSEIVKFTTSSGSLGLFEFSHISSGSYNLWAVFNSRQSSKHPDVQVSGGKPTQVDKLVIRSQKRPVVLVAGIMGSTKKGSKSPLPTLPAKEPADQEDLELSAPGTVGWETLKNQLREHYETFDCPYDWRVSLRSSKMTYLKYLRSVIDQAKDATGWEKVDIVAHSMGGLIARSYIQSEDFKHDVDKFAMVGTPNHGSLKAYYLWEGGDPKLLDLKVGPTVHLPLLKYFYSNVCNNIYKEQHGGQNMFFYSGPGNPEWMKISKEEARDYFSFYVMSLRELMPTFDNCLSGSNSEIENEKNKNQWLIELNKDSNNIDRIKQGGEVITRNFYAVHENTISQITVKRSTIANLYEDGEPKGDPEKGDAGDTTVLWKSADIPDVYSVPNWSGEHGELIGVFVADIKNFLDQDRSFGSASQTNLGKVKATLQTYLGLSFRGQAAPFITDPSKVKCGINDTSQMTYDNPDVCDIIRDPSGGGISLANPIPGNYTLTLTGKSAGEVALTMTLVADNNMTYEQNQIIFYPGKTTSFSFHLDPAATPPINIEGLPSQPLSLIAVPASVGGVQKTKLKWAKSLDQQLFSYRIYSRRSDEPIFQRIATVRVPVNVYQSKHLWNDPKRLYAVSSVDEHGKESFLSEVVENRIRTVANFTASPITGKAPLVIRFSDQSTGSITARVWDFGDGRGSTKKNPSHKYLKPGTYDVRLVVQSADGQDMEIKPGYVIVE